MSRWTKAFEEHPIHQTLEQLLDWAKTEFEETQENREVERRRMVKVLESIKRILASLDPEFYPEGPLNQINNDLTQPNAFNQMQSFAQSGNPSNMKTANDHLTTCLPHVYQLAAQAMNPADRETIKGLETSVDRFHKNIDKSEKEFRSKIIDADKKLASLKADMNNLQATQTELLSNTETTLSGWQSEFTTAQTSRAEEHSKSQIDREEKFEAAMRDSRTATEKQSSEIADRFETSLTESFDAYKNDIGSKLKDAKLKHDAILEIHELVGTDGVAGGYQKGATDERNAANLWRLIAMGALVLAAGWLLVAFFTGIGSSQTGEFNWPELLKVTSLTLVLLAAAGYASRQSRVHREAEQQMRWFALEVKAIDPFISSLGDSDQKELKKKLVEKLFGQQRVSVGSRDDGIDPDTYKSVTNAVLEPVTEAMKSVNK